MKASMDREPAAPVRLFRNQAAWAAWLEKNHRKSDGLWLRLAKKDSGLRSVSYVEALEVALCYGWIDGQKKGESEQAWLQRFLPRSAKSIWSKINRDKALALIADGRMKATGLGAVEIARKNGRWDSAYASQKTQKCRKTYRWRWMRTQRRETFSSRSIARIDMRCSSASTR